MAIFHKAIWKLSLFHGSCEVFAPSGADLEPPPHAVPSLVCIPRLLLLSLQSVTKPYRSRCLRDPIPWRVVLEGRGQE